MIMAPIFLLLMILMSLACFRSAHLFLKEMLNRQIPTVGLNSLTQFCFILINYRKKNVTVFWLISLKPIGSIMTLARPKTMRIGVNRIKGHISHTTIPELTRGSFGVLNLRI